MGEREDLIDQYTKQLGLVWRVQTMVADVDRPQIISSKIDQLHRISMPLIHGARVHEYRADYVHELVHAKFSETLDPVFATVYFHSRYDSNDLQFLEQAQQMYYAQQLIDVWVSDQMGKLDRNLPQEDVQSWVDLAVKAERSLYQEMPLEIVLGYALNRAQIVRENMRGFEKGQSQVLRNIQDYLGPDAAKTAQRLGKLYQSLPPLPLDNKEEALKLFESSSQRAAEILGFSINPMLVEDNDKWAWTVD